MTDCIKELYDKIDQPKMGGNKKNGDSSSIMQPIDDLPINEEYFLDIRPNIPQDDEVISEPPFQSLTLNPKGESFLLIDQEGNLKVDSVEQLIHDLDCPDDCKLKVITIIGNSGDGKSYTLNHVKILLVEIYLHLYNTKFMVFQLFFRGREIFKTSKFDEEGTRGIWAAYHPARRLLCLDTPPLHHPNSALLLMKVF